MQGQPLAPAPTVEVLVATGVADFGARVGPPQSSPQRLSGRAYCEDLAAAVALVAAVRALKGTLVTITDERGTEHANCFVEDATAGTPKRVKLLVGGLLLDRDRVDCEFVVIRHGE